MSAEEESERDDSLAKARAYRDVVLVADPSAEGESIASALRAHGFVVMDAPIALLEARIVGESPKALVIDLDQAGAYDALERVRELSALSEMQLLCVGESSRAAELGVMSCARAFTRPVDIDRLVAEVASFATPSRDNHPARGTTPPPSFASRRETGPPAPAELEAEGTPVSDYPAAIGADAAILSVSEEQLGNAKVIQTEFSPELERILSAAAQRVSAEAAPSIPPASVEDEVDLLLSPELLAALDEPIDPEEEDQGTGSGLGTGVPLASHATASRTAIASPSQPGGAPPRNTAVGVGASHEDRPHGHFASEPAATHRGLTPAPASSTAEPFVDAQEHEDPQRQTQQPSPSRADFVPSPSSLAASRIFPEPVFRPLDPEPVARPQPIAPFLETPPRNPLGATITALPSELIVAPPPVDIPTVLGEGDAVRALAHAIAGRISGSLALNTERGLRRIVLQDGDVLTAGSGLADETLLSFLSGRGDIERDTAQRLSGKLPPFGRHAGAALIAHGHLGQEDLWPVLRAHAEWIIGRAVVEEGGTCEVEADPPGRFKAEPSVFGGATGAEVFVETLRRVIPPDLAVRRLGGSLTRLDEGPRRSILGECALRPEEHDAIRSAPGKTVSEVAASAPTELATVIYACVALEILGVLAATGTETAGAPNVDPLDEEAIRARVRARLALVEDGDYFALLGVSRSATGYEIRRAYLELRRTLEPARLLTGATADLVPDLRLICEVLDEAYTILKEPHRRERYRRAIEAGPP
jgi:hypothetical protein